MRSRGIRAHTLLPGARRLRPLLQRFCDGGYGIVTAASEPSLAVARSLMPEESTVDVEPFGAFVQGLLARLGVPCGNLVYSGHYIAAIAEACLELPSESPFWQTRKFRGVHRRIADSLKELAQYRIDLENLDEIESTSGDLLARIQDLAKIDSTARESLKLLGRQTHADQLKLLLEQKGSKADLPSRVLVLADSDLAPMQVDAIQWLAQSGVSVWVTMPQPVGEGAFAWSRGLRSELLGSVEPEPQLIEDPQGAAEEPIILPWYVGSNEPRPMLRFSSSADAFAECEWAVKQCKERLDEGEMTTDLAIYVRDTSSYAPMLLAAAEQAGLPLSCQRRIPLMTNALARLVLAVLKAMAGRDVRDLRVLTDSSYAAIDAQTKAEALHIWREAYRQKSEAWSLASEAFSNASEPLHWVGEILSWRAEALTSLRPTEGWIQELRRLLPLIPRGEDAETGIRDQRAGTVMQRSLIERASLTRLRERESLDLRGFARICAEVWEDADVSIPTSEHGVIVTSTPKLLAQRRQVLVLGMTEGVFPRRRREDPILSDDDRRKLSEKLHLKSPLPTSHADSVRELEAFYEICAEAGDVLSCSFPRTVEDRDNARSSYFEALQTLAPSEELRAWPREMPLASEGQAPIDEPRLTAASAIQASFTPSELRNAFECGFQHYARHQLNLRKGDFTTHWHRLRRIRSQLPIGAFTDRSSAIAGLESALIEHLDSHFGELPVWEVPLLLAGGRRLVGEWVSREFTSRAKWSKDAGSTVADVEFGGGLRANLGKGILIHGRVEATSKLGDYAVVHLVESRSPDFRTGELSDAETLYYGLYLLAICEQATSAAVEVDGMDGKRCLMVVPRLPGTVLASDRQECIEFVSLDPSDDPYDAKRRFYERVKELLKVAVARIREGDITPRPGNHCYGCDYGELCRRSIDFGEEESPFDDAALVQ